MSREKERMSVEERQRHLEDRLRWIVRHACENAPAIRQKFQQAGIDPSQICTVKDLEKVPVTTRDDFIRLQRASPPFGGFLAAPLEMGKRIYVHPGPQYETNGQELHKSLVRAFQRLGFKKGETVLVTASYHLVFAGLVVDDALTSIGAIPVPSGPGNTDLQVQILRDLKITGYVGLPSFLMGIIKRAEELGYNFRHEFALKHALWMGSASIRKVVEEDYGIEAREVYGAAPIGVVACECELKSGIHIDEGYIVEIVDPATGKQLGPGERGEIVVTNFDEVFPFIRFGTGDLSYYTDEPCPCGRTSPRLVRVVGRIGEAVKLRGMFIHPLEIDDVVSGFPAIYRYQVLVNRIGLKDKVIVRIVVRTDAKEGQVDRETLVESFRRRLQDRCRLRIDQVELVTEGTIPQEAERLVDLRKEIIL